MKIKKIRSCLKGPNNRMHSGAPLSMLVGTIFSMVLGTLLSSCSQPQQQVTPIYQGLYTPKALQMTFGSRLNGTTVDFSIDNNKMRIFNETPLPYGTELDSAYLTAYLSNQVPITLTNLETGTQKWMPGDSAKISVKGGRLTLEINRDKHPSVTYDLRIMSYGYDPDKLTWSDLGDILPIRAETGKILEKDGRIRYLGRTGQESRLYAVSVDPAVTFTPVAGAAVPSGLRPETVIEDIHGRYWALADNGSLYSSKDLSSWILSYDVSATGEPVYELLGDNSKTGSTAASITAVTRTPGAAETYLIRTLLTDAEGRFTGFGPSAEVPEAFPVRDAFIFSYTVSGTRHSATYGGTDAEGNPSPKSYFTSDGLNWAETPLSSAADVVPATGGLFLLDPTDPNHLILIGGTYADGASAKIKVSNDRGLAWSELSQEQSPGTDFTARTMAAGILLEDANGTDHVYIFGGLIGGVPSSDVWHGYLDKTGGIINAF